MTGRAADRAQCLRQNRLRGSYVAVACARESCGRRSVPPYRRRIGAPVPRGADDRFQAGWPPAPTELNGQFPVRMECHAGDSRTMSVAEAIKKQYIRKSSWGDMWSCKHTP